MNSGLLTRYAAAGAALLLPLPVLARFLPAREGALTRSRAARTVTVVGEGRVKVVPDVAIAQVGVQTVRKTLAEASDVANTTMRKVLDLLKSSGIPQADIQTSSFSVNVERRYDETTGATEITGFRVANQVQVKLRELTQVGGVLDRVIEAGANDIYGVSFTVDDVTGVRARARAAAVQDAQAKALQLTRISHASLGQVTRISELTDGASPGLKLRATRADEAVPIEAGELEVIEHVQVVYSLR